jgi:hypothetical protein
MLRLSIVLLLLSAPVALAQERPLDDGRGLDGWTAEAPEGVSARLVRDGDALRLDFDFHGGGGFAIARRAVDLALPANYRFRFVLRAEGPGGRPAPMNDLEFKLLDPSGENVWWHNRRRFRFPTEWVELTSRRRHVEFAWGPQGGGVPERVAAVEVVVAAVEGGRGSVWVRDLTFEPLPEDVPYTRTPEVSVSGGTGGALVLDGRGDTAWTAPEGAQTLTLDFGREREFGGAVLAWAEGRAAVDYDVALSADGQRWTTAYHVRGGRGGHDYLPTPEAVARYLRLSFHRSEGEGYALRRVDVQPLEFSATANGLFSAIAAHETSGRYPRMFLGEQTYWTVVGVDGGEHEALVGEDGTVEGAAGRFSVEPFLWTGGRLLGWREADSTMHALRGGYLPIPSATRHHGGLRLRVTAFAEGEPGAARLVLRYRIENAGSAEASGRLMLAVRPFQVNPPEQWLNLPGGVGRIERITTAEGSLGIEGRRLQAATPASATGATTFAAGDVTEWLARGEVPEARTAEDPDGLASGALAFDFALPAGAWDEVVLTLPLDPGARSAPLAAGRRQASAEADRREAAVAEGWRSRLDRVAFVLPPEAEALGRALRSQLAYVLINRDGPAIQPGSRAYERSWIRDGSLTSAAMLRMGYPEAAEAFARWYAPFQYPSGKVPCCVDRRGADPTAEHDSHGQLIYLAAEVHRFTGDDGFLRDLWPHVRAAVAYLDTLRHERMRPEYAAVDSLRAYYGMLPESISHEGYSAKPMHSYWDALFAVRGLKDAVYVAEALGETAEATRFAAIRDAFAADLSASYRRTMAVHGIDYLPGSVELGDFDATSVTVALDPADAREVLPEGALEATFERFWAFFVHRRDGGEDWGDYTPYEWRNVGAFVRLGWKERAHEAIAWYLSHRRPEAWNAFAEVVDVYPRRPRFLGDIPHTWVGSDFIRAVTDLFAYEEGDRLVLAAGIPEAWARSATGAGVRALRTVYGPLTYHLRAEGSDLVAEIEAGVSVPPGGLVVHPPFGRDPREILLDGRPAEREAPGLAIVRTLPARLTFRY